LLYKSKYMKTFIDAVIQEKKSIRSGLKEPLSIPILLSVKAIIALSRLSENGDCYAILKTEDVEALTKKYFQSNSEIGMILIEAAEVKKLLE